MKRILALLLLLAAPCWGAGSAVKSYIGQEDINWDLDGSTTFSRQTSTGGSLTLHKVPTIYLHVIDCRGLGATGDGTTDDATALQACFTAAAGKTAFLAAGTYVTSATVTIPSNTTVLGEGPVSVVKLKASANVDVLSTTDTSNVTLRNFKVDGNRASQASANLNAFYALRVSDLTLEGMTFTGARAENVRIDAAVTQNYRVRIKDCTFSSSGRENLYITGVDVGAIQGNFFTSWGSVTAAVPAIKWSEDNLNIVEFGNIFKNTDGTQFAEESSYTGLHTVMDGYANFGNVADAGALAGGGFSGYYYRSAFTGNVIANGTGTHRSGYEIVGNQNALVGNVVENGAIAIEGSTGGATGKTLVLGNNIMTDQPSTNEGTGIFVGGTGVVTDVGVMGNLVEMTNAAPQTGIFLGYFGVSSQVNRIAAISNMIRGPGAKGGAVRILGDTGSTDFLVANNLGTGLEYGLVASSDNKNDEVTFVGNDVRGSTTPYIGTPTGGTYRYAGNITANDLTGGISADRGDASATLYARVDEPVQLWGTTLTGNKVVTLSTNYAKPGDRFRVVRTGLGAFTLDVGGLKTIPNSTAAFVDVEFNGTAWVLTGYGAL